MAVKMSSRALAAAIAIAAVGTLAYAQDKRASDADLVKKEVFTLETYTTVGGKTIKSLKAGWQSMGTLNADKSNAILVAHFFSGTSHFAGKYKADDKAAGYWDAIIGPGKAIDTNKYYVVSMDTLVNLNAKDPMVTTTGPASVNPDTGKPYAMGFPVVTIRDFVNVQKALVDRLGIKKLHAVMGASMGALQAYEWAASYPDMVSRVIPVIGAGESDGYLIAWLDMWAAPIKVDQNWKGGDYYGGPEPLAGLAAALKIVTLHAQHWAWTNSAPFGRKWAAADKNPADCMMDCRYAIEAVLDGAGRARAAISDANHFLYLVKANQIFAAGGNVEEGLKRINAPVLLITTDDDLVFHVDGVKRTADLIKSDGTPLEHVKIKGGRGHLDGVLHIGQAAAQITAFLSR